MFANKLKIEPPPVTGGIEELREWLMRFYDRLMKPPNVLVVSADSDDLDVTNYDVVRVSTAGGNIVIGGMKGGAKGQSLYIYKGSLANALTLEHNEGVGTFNIYTDSASDIVFPANTYGGAVLIFKESGGWFVLSTHSRS